jgi:hypothetical protein
VVEAARVEATADSGDVGGSDQEVGEVSRTVEEVDGDGWRKVIVIDDWGHLGFFLRIVESDSGTRGLSEQDPTWRLRLGQCWQVRYPDGHVDQAVIDRDPVSRDVSDHGRKYYVGTFQLVVRHNTHGVIVSIPVEKLQFKAVG